MSASTVSRVRLVFALAALVLAACTTTPPRKPQPVDRSLAHIEAQGDGREIVMYSLGLLDVGYQFGGNNPEAGLDCSGMVRFVYKKALGIDLPRTAADIASRTRPIAESRLQAGDLVFFNTLGKPYSHVGIYLGDGKFVHAPSSRGKIRVESMSLPYFSSRFEGARTVFAQGK
ncbi:C40 family peptidase [Jeongeupia wiesaeckerbachi]|uniref:C40 family peptidase n=1 Tax=Jeongeupia wiesaeckerbachi TaxID=3051218 RepID=UPI003D8031A5